MRELSRCSDHSGKNSGPLHWAHSIVGRRTAVAEIKTHGTFLTVACIGRDAADKNKQQCCPNAFNGYLGER